MINAVNGSRGRCGGVALGDLVDAAGQLDVLGGHAAF
jgi:hypothetical protein